MRWRETDSQTKRNDEQIDVDRSERDQSEKNGGRNFFIGSIDNKTFKMNGSQFALMPPYAFFTDLHFSFWKTKTKKW
jgi:hypothetical protein